jgi:hypothetical protein
MMMTDRTSAPGSLAVVSVDEACSAFAVLNCGPLPSGRLVSVAVSENRSYGRGVPRATGRAT